MEKIKASTIESRQEQIINQFQSISNEFDRYDYLISLGCLGETPTDPELYQDCNLMKSCQSKLWVLIKVKEDRVTIFVDSDSVVVRGIAILLASIFDGSTKEEAAKAEIQLLEHIGLGSLLSTVRQNGIREMTSLIQNL